MMHSATARYSVRAIFDVILFVPVKWKKSQTTFLKTSNTIHRAVPQIIY